MYKNQTFYINTSNPHTQKRVSTMIYYLFPRSSYSYIKKTIPKITETNHDVDHSFSLFYYLNELKLQCLSLDKWNILNHLIHPYNLLNTIAKHSRSNEFYEILEIYNLLRLSWTKQSNFVLLHFFNDDTIQALKHIRQEHSSECHFIPNHNISIYTISHYVNKADFIYCKSFSSSEYDNSIDLIRQICVAISRQKYKGTCFIKIGDIFTKLSLHIITFISHFYEKTYFVKPSVCNLTSSEKYIVCKGFVYEQFDTLISQKIFDILKATFTCPSGHYLYGLFNIEIPLFLKEKVEELNSIFGQSRLEQMFHVLVACENRDYDFNRHCEGNRYKCKEWCIKHNIEII